MFSRALICLLVFCASAQAQRVADALLPPDVELVSQIRQGFEYYQRGEQYAQLGLPAGIAELTRLFSTPPPPACSGTNYFVALSGNDANNGTSSATPWQTIAKVNAGPPGKFQAGNCINFFGNNTFNGNLVLSTANVASSSSGSPITVQSYNIGSATLQASSGGADESTAVHITDVWVNFTNLFVRPGATPPRWGINVDGSSGGTIANNDVGGFTALPLAVGHYSVDILIRSSNPVTVSGNQVHGLAGVTSQDDTGINADGMSAAYSILGNAVFNIGGRTGANGAANGTSGNGITLNNNGNSLGTVSFNLVHDNGANTNNCGGPSGILAYNQSNLTVSFNEVYNTRPNNGVYPGVGCDWDGIDLDGGVFNSVVQYNYTHENAGAGLLAFMGPVDGQWGNNTYRGNISQNDLTQSQLNGFFGQVTFSNEGGSLPKFYFYNNTIYNGSNAPNNSAISITGAAPAVAPGTLIANNIIVTTGNNKFLSCNLGNFANIVFRNNNYYPSGGTSSWGSGCGGSTSTSLAAWMVASGETGAINTNPNLFGPVPRIGACGSLLGPQPCPPGYVLLLGSPAIGTGVNPASLGAPAYTRDYYGSTVPNGAGSGYNIGAYGGNAAVCQVLFSENFSGGYATNWNIGFPWEAGVNVYSPTYVQANPTVSPGMDPFTTGANGLTIGAKLTNGNPDAQGRVWYTGLLASKFLMQFGYVEFRTAMPLSPGGVNGANWIYPNGPSQNAEIDTIEHRANLVMQTVHNPANLNNPTQNTTVGNVTQFHTYGTDLQSNFTTFYIDGVQTFQIATLSNYLLGVPLQIVLSVNIGDGVDTPTPAQDGTVIPQFMTVSNVGVWPNKASRDACGAP